MTDAGHPAAADSPRAAPARDVAPGVALRSRTGAALIAATVLASAVTAGGVSATGVTATGGFS